MAKAERRLSYKGQPLGKDTLETIGVAPMTLAARREEMCSRVAALAARSRDDWRGLYDALCGMDDMLELLFGMTEDTDGGASRASVDVLLSLASQAVAAAARVERKVERKLENAQAG